MNIKINNSISYKVAIGKNNLYEELNGYLDYEYFVCLDSRVALFFDEYLNTLLANAKDIIVIESSEKNKNFKNVELIHDMLYQNNANRSSNVIAIGGGIIGDLVGFACSIYLRGINYIQVPTTLLAQVDSSIGAKVGINAYESKNHIGSFYPPKKTIIDTFFLSKLSTRLYKEGLVELIKHGLINDIKIIEYIMQYDNINDLIDNSDIQFLIEKSLKVKLDIISQDYNDTGIRHVLNLGHTFAHALELSENNNLYHGECVAIGILVNALGSKAYVNLKALFTKFELIRAFPNVEYQKMYQDKKRQNNNINEVFLENIGKTYIKNVSIDSLIEIYQNNYTKLKNDYTLFQPFYEIHPTTLSGEVTIPCSKSQLHRYLIASSLANKCITLKNIDCLNDDILVTINTLKYLGTKVEYDAKARQLLVYPYQYGNLSNTINMKESGTSLRLLMPLLLTTGYDLTFVGENKLPLRPLTTYLNIFDEQNISYTKDTKNFLPLKINSALTSGEYFINENISSQFISGLLFTLPLLNGDSIIKCSMKPNSLPYIEMTLDVLKDFGIDIITNETFTEYQIRGNQQYQGLSSYAIEQDYSSRCFFEVAKAIDKNKITITNPITKSKQGDLEVVKMIHNNTTFLDLKHTPDAAPIMSIYFSLRGGTLANTQRLVYKESNRLDAICDMMDGLGIKGYLQHNQLTIQASTIKGGFVNTYNDHRITMSAIIAATFATHPIKIKEINSINKSYPTFIQHFEALGGFVDEK